MKAEREPRRELLGSSAKVGWSWARWAVVTAWTACGVMTVFATALLAAWITADPRTVYVPVFVRVGDEGDQVIQFRVGAVSGDLRDTIGRKLLCQLVTAREPIDGVTETERYRSLRALLDSKLYEAFLGEMSFENKDSPLKRFLDAGMSRDVTCGHPRHIGADVWQVPFRTIDYRGRANNRVGPGGDPAGRVVETERHWVASVRVRYSDQQITLEDAMINPYGMTVVHYKVSES